MKCARSHALVTTVGTPRGEESTRLRVQTRETLKERVLEIFEANRSIYGAPRLTEELKSRGIDVSEATVGRIMAELGIQGASGRAKTITTRPDRHAKKSVDLVKRNFTVHVNGHAIMHRCGQIIAR
ncbi:MAG: IS3 family transposase [Ferrimicrobium acidiphilum]